jgi:hypothetical protein
MPRRQRFKPSRKPKPAIEPSEQELVAQPTLDQESQEMTGGQRADESHEHSNEDRVSR